MGFEVTTTDAKAIAAITNATIIGDGFHNIFKVRLELTGADAWIMPAKNIDDLASDAAAAQADVIVTNVDRFAVDDYILLMEDDYTTYEFGKIVTVTTGTSTLTLETNLTNTYHVADNTDIVIVPNDTSFIPLRVGYILNESGCDWPGLYFRRMEANNATVKGFVVIS